MSRRDFFSIKMPLKSRFRPDFVIFKTGCREVLDRVVLIRRALR